MIANAVVYVFAPTTGKNSEGTTTKTWTYASPLATIDADVQPAGLSQDALALYGISKDASEAKKMFYSDCSYIVAGNRVVVASDLTGETEYYDVRGMNAWATHREAILTPCGRKERWILASALPGSKHFWDDLAKWMDFGAWHD